MNKIKTLLLTIILAIAINFAFFNERPAEAGVVAFKAALLTAVQNNFTAGQRTVIVDSFASAYGYQANINGNANPQSKGDFAADKIVGYIQDIVRGEQTKTAINAVVTPTPIPE